MEKTIKQISDEIGVDKQKVYRYIKKNHINESHQENGVMYYDQNAQNIIKNALYIEKENKNHINELHQNHISEAVIDTLLKQSEILKNELEFKNQQIAEMQKLLDQEQQLRMAEHKRVLYLEQKEEQKEETEPIKKGWKFWK